ncbi:MAG: NVEALA domain-containing protein [Bacteroidales bacterium]|nr:NVEALA domain-containing protein [Bacteroidales bacterium]
MKKFVLAVAIAMAGAWSIFQANQNNNQLSDLQLENLEAFAQFPSGEHNSPCPNGCLPNGNHCVCGLTWNCFLEAN